MSNKTRRSSRLVKRTQLINPETLPAATPTEKVNSTVINDFGGKLLHFRRDHAAKALGEGAGNLVQNAVTGFSNNGIWMIEHVVADSAYLLSNAAEAVTRKARNAGTVAMDAAKDKEQEVIQGLTSSAHNALTEATELGNAVAKESSQRLSEGLSEMKSAQADRKAAALQERIDNGEDVRSLTQKMRDRVAAYTGDVDAVEVVEVLDKPVPLPEAVPVAVEAPVTTTASTALGRLVATEQAKADAKA